MFDVIIIGGGMAGMTSALYSLRNNKTVLILEEESIGGQMATSPRVENYPSFKAISGGEIADKDGGHEVGLCHPLLPEHERGDDKAHAERGADIGQRGELIALEERAEAPVVRKGEYGGVIGKISRDDAESRRAGKIIDRLHKRGKYFIQQADHAELRKDSGKSAHQHRYRHYVKAGVDEYFKRRVHQRAEHIGKPHLHRKKRENAENDDQTDQSGDPPGQYFFAPVDLIAFPMQGSTLRQKNICGRGEKTRFSARPYK